MKVISSYTDGRLTLYLRGELDHHEASAVLRNQPLKVIDASGIDRIINVSTGARPAL